MRIMVDSCREDRMKRIMAVAVLLLTLLFVEGTGIWVYRNSEAYLYGKSMERANACYADGKWKETYEAYQEALCYKKEDEEALRGAVLSDLEEVRESDNMHSIIRTYKELFRKYAYLFQEEELSGRYLECAEYYLKTDAPMGAVELLEEGEEIFTEEETIKRIQEKTEDILAHTIVKSKTKYSWGEKEGFFKYDDYGREIESWETYKPWIFKSYDESGNLIEWEWRRKQDRGKSIITDRGYLIYDENNNLLHSMTYYLEESNIGDEDIWGQAGNYTYDENNNLVHGVKYDLGDEENTLDYEESYIYDEEGNVIYSKISEYGRGYIWKEEERQKLADDLWLVRGCDPGLTELIEKAYYELEKRNENGDVITIRYADTYTIDAIRSGRADPDEWERNTYDESGNCIARYHYYSYFDKEHQDYIWKYDERGNMIKEVRMIPRGTETTIWNYDDRGLLIKKEKIVERDGEVDDLDSEEESYLYDDDGRLIQMKNKCDRTEYDRLGNPTKTFRKCLHSSEEKLREQWIYQFHYTGNQNALSAT